MLEKKFFFEIFDCKFLFLKNFFFLKMVDLYTCLGKVPKIVKVLGLGVGLGIYLIPEI